MDWTLTTYKETPEVVLPWHGEKTEFTINRLEAKCKKCNTILIGLRGNIYESFDVIELDVAGVCTQCRAITSSRSRINPKTMTFSYTDKGLWRNTKMEKVPKNSWFNAAWNTFQPMAGGFLLVASVTWMVSEVNRWTLLIWGVFIIFMVILSIVVGWKKSRKQ